MTAVKFQAMSAALRAQAAKFPNCTIANCECNSRGGGEWRKGCLCMCHFAQMNTVFGNGKWGLKEFNAAAAKSLKLK